MSRPQSSSSSSSRPSTASASNAAGQTASVNPTPSSQQDDSIPPNIDLFLRNVRLLDLDLRPDWPALTAQTFRAGRDAHRSQRERVRTTEWVLVKLFELWSPKETQSRLQPYFPALEPRQSIQLRASLFQWLSELKNNGTLGRDCPLRKSTLDECRGDKLEEVLFLFSAAVLRKTAHERKGKGQASIAEQLATSHRLNDEDEGRVHTVKLAHEHSLRASMQEKARAEARHRRLQRQLTGKLGQLEARATETMTTMASYEEHLATDKLDITAMKNQLRDQCSGNSTWLSLLISGDPESGRNGFTEDTWDNIWASNKSDSSKEYNDSPKGLLADLDSRLVEQQRRLDEWRLFQVELSRRNESFIVPRTPSKTPSKTLFKTPSKGAKPSPVKTPSKRPYGVTAPKSPKKVTAKVFTDTTSTKSPIAGSGRPQSNRLSETSRKLSEVTDAGPSEADARDAQGKPDLAKTKSLPSPPPTPSTIGDKMANLNLNTPRHTDPEDIDMAVIDAHPASPNATSADRQLKSRQLTGTPAAEPQASAGLQEALTEEAGSPSKKTIHSKSPAGHAELQTQGSSERARQSHSSIESPSQKRVSPSLNRVSPGLNRASPMATAQSPPGRSTNGQLQTTPTTPTRNATLLERTRDSLFQSTQTTATTAAAGRTRPPLHRKTRSVQLPPMYPVNPFESPSKTAESRPLQAPQPTLQRRAQASPPASRQIVRDAPATPHAGERFAEEGDYASIFKPRPRIRTSPPGGSPRFGVDGAADDNHEEGDDFYEKEVL